MVEHALLPALGQILCAVDVFGEEAIFVRNAEIVEHGLDHVQMGDQDGLRKLGGELFVVSGSRAAPNTRGADFAQRFGVQLGHMQARFQAIEKLKRFQFSERDGAQQFARTTCSPSPRKISDNCIKPSVTCSTRPCDTIQ